MRKMYINYYHHFLPGTAFWPQIPSRTSMALLLCFLCLKGITALYMYRDAYREPQDTVQPRVECIHRLGDTLLWLVASSFSRTRLLFQESR